MRYDPVRHHRRSTRLKGWDYTHPGSYYVTLVIRDRQCLLGRVVNGVMEHSPLGLVVDECWREIPQHHAGIDLDEHIVMPNDVHGIVIIKGTKQTDVDVFGGDVRSRDVQLNVPTGITGAVRPMSPAKGSISVILRTFKAAVTTWAHENGQGEFTWLGRFHDHIIRNEQELNRIREYIRNNPLHWALDNENPENNSGNPRPK